MGGAVKVMMLLVWGPFAIKIEPGKATCLSRLAPQYLTMFGATDNIHGVVFPVTSFL